jgi:hypothetical protein
MAEKQGKIPGFPGPSESVVEKQQNLIRAFRVLHSALVEAFEALPEGCTLNLTRKVKGDIIKVSFKAGAPEEAEEKPDVPRLTV